MTFYGLQPDGTSRLLYSESKVKRWEEYIQKMAQDGTWGEHIEIQAACDVYDVDIAVHSVTGRGDY